MRKADNLPPSCAVVTKSGSLNFLEPFGPVQACNETDLFMVAEGMNFTTYLRLMPRLKITDAIPLSNLYVFMVGAATTLSFLPCLLCRKDFFLSFA